MKTFDLSIVILSYNVKELLLDCISSIERYRKSLKLEIIVVDNNSSDDSVSAVRRKFPNVIVIRNYKNMGFGAGNNKAIPFAHSKFILFLNPDTLLVNDVLEKSLFYMKKHPEVGALTCQVDLPNGKLDKSCHRGLPTPWNAFCHFSGLSKIFPKNKLFSGYTASYLDLSKIHEVDCTNGTYFMVRKSAGEMVGWWDEDYFWNGEDIEFCYQLKKKGWKIVYFPDRNIIHFKGSSSGLQSTRKTTVARETTLRAAKSAAQAMRIFYKKHYLSQQPFVVKFLTLFGINLLEKIRIMKILLGVKYE